MPFLLNFVYLLLLLAATPWLLWTSFRKGKYREGFAEKFFGRVPMRKSDRKCAWFHAVSVGEVTLLPHLVQEFRKQRPDWDCAISTTTQTGMALAKKRFPDSPVFYCPLDFSWAVRTALRRIRPDLLVLAELELWPNLITLSGRAGAEVCIVNGRLSPGSFRGYKRIRFLAAWLLRKVRLIAVQDETYAERFRYLGGPPERVVMTGSMKFDGAVTDRENPATRDLRRLAGIGENDTVFLAGSTQEGEESAALAAYANLHEAHPDLRLILVPRHPERFDAVARLLEESPFAWSRRSGLSETNPAERILLVDTVGELGAWWGTARIAFVGGSFGKRNGQNMIEPAAYGAAVSFGPNTRNFRDIVDTMLRHDAAIVVADAAELEQFVQRCLEEPAFADELGHRAQQLVREQSGALARTVELLNGVC